MREHAVQRHCHDANCQRQPAASVRVESELVLMERARSPAGQPNHRAIDDRRRIRTSRGFRDGFTGHHSQRWRIQRRHQTITDLVAETHLLLGYTYAGFAGDLERAAAARQACLDTCEPTGESWFRSYSLWHLGLVVWLTTR